MAKVRVIYTNPQAGNAVARGTTVDLVLSTGNTSVPDVSGQDEATAKKSIEDAGLQFKKGDDVASAEVERGKAVSSNPAAGTSVSAGDTITVSFSSGAATPNATVTIPNNLNGKTVEEATAELQKLGLNVTTVTKTSDTVERNKVIGTDPTAGTKVSAGSTVTLTVSSGKNGGGDDNNKQQPGNPNPGGGGGGGGVNNGVG